jgi:hypothetical protein
MVRTKRSSHPRGRCMWVGAGHTPVVAVLSCVCKSPTSASLPPKGEDRGPPWQFFPANRGFHGGI